MVPEAISWVAARTRGRVDQRVLLPGVVVEPDTIILELSNPEVEQARLVARAVARVALERGRHNFGVIGVAIGGALFGSRGSSANGDGHDHGGDVGTAEGGGATIWTCSVLRSSSRTQR